MRPRVFPAEDGCHAHDRPGRPRGFNEAAGIPRGRRSRWSARSSRARCFNEAAGIPRGRPRLKLTTLTGTACFNEAAGIPRGRPTLSDALALRAPAASMRPRVFPAEDFKRSGWGEWQIVELQ